MFIKRLYTFIFTLNQFVFWLPFSAPIHQARAQVAPSVQSKAANQGLQTKSLIGPSCSKDELNRKVNAIRLSVICSRDPQSEECQSYYVYAPEEYKNTEKIFMTTGGVGGAVLLERIVNAKTKQRLASANADVLNAERRFSQSKSTVDELLKERENLLAQDKHLKGDSFRDEVRRLDQDLVREKLKLKHMLDMEQRSLQELSEMISRDPQMEATLRKAEANSAAKVKSLKMQIQLLEHPTYRDRLALERMQESNLQANKAARAKERAKNNKAIQRNTDYLAEDLPEYETRKNALKAETQALGKLKNGVKFAKIVATGVGAAVGITAGALTAPAVAGAAVSYFVSEGAFKAYDEAAANSRLGCDQSGAKYYADEKDARGECVPVINSEGLRILSDDKLVEQTYETDKAYFCDYVDKLYTQIKTGQYKFFRTMPYNVRIDSCNEPGGEIAISYPENGKEDYAEHRRQIKLAVKDDRLTRVSSADLSANQKDGTWVLMNRDNTYSIKNGGSRTGKPINLLSDHATAEYYKDVDNSAEMMLANQAFHYWRQVKYCCDELTKSDSSCNQFYPGQKSGSTPGGVKR